MLRTDLLEVVNRGGVWAFVGSGISIDAGGPTWRQLVDRTLDGIDGELLERIRSDNRFKTPLEAQDFARCLQVVEDYVARDALEAGVSRVLRNVTKPGEIGKIIADWPFAGYITTNLDPLIENALVEGSQSGWTAVGNLPDEVRKVSRDATRLVWHLHGMLGMTRDKSRLILTEKDYDDFYLDDAPAIVQLRGLLSQRRVVFIGFGLRDPEVMRALKKVSRLSDPARPVFAFFHGPSSFEADTQRQELLNRFNIDVVPYQTVDGSHRQLGEILNVYSSLLLRRSITFGHPERPIPSYDPEATGLLVYDELCLRAGAPVSADLLRTLLRARVLTLLKYSPTRTVRDYVIDLSARARVIQGAGVPEDAMLGEIETVLRGLVESKHIEVVQEGGVSGFRLTKDGQELVKDQAATAERLSEQFIASLRVRALEQIPHDPHSARRVQQAAEAFLKECIDRRALGVALSLYSLRSEYQSYHITALLQSLPEFTQQLRSRSEAIGLIRLILGILANPNDAESKFIGLALQAKFGVHLLGYDQDTLRARVRDLTETLFLIDSSTLIPLLAQSSVGNSSSQLLVTRIQGVGSTPATTELLVQEVAEHARWAIARVEAGTGRPNLATLEASTGRAGERSNAFIEGFLTEVQRGVIPPDLIRYLQTICRITVRLGGVQEDDVKMRLVASGIQYYAFDEWEGFQAELFAERDARAEEIGKLRTERGTYRHERQVKAEGEALLIVLGLRNGQIRVQGRNVRNAFFVSHTRVIDEVARGGMPVTIRPEAVLQWMATVSPCSVDEYSALTSSLLWELTERDLKVVDRAHLQAVFGPLIAPTKERLGSEIERHRALIAQYYGEPAVAAFRQVDDVDAPVVYVGLKTQFTDELIRKLEQETERRVALQDRAHITDRERAELGRLRMEKKLREARARAKKRAIQSATGKRRRRRRRGK